MAETPVENNFEDNKMLLTNPFAELSALISPEVMQMYIIVMAVLVAGGTILDMMHKKSAKYFFLDSAKAAKNAKRNVGIGEKAGLAVATLANEVLTSGEFCNIKRRISHLLTMYGFILFVATSALMIFEFDCYCNIDISAGLAYWCNHALCWWLLVLVLSSALTWLQKEQNGITWSRQTSLLSHFSQQRHSL